MDVESADRHGYPDDEFITAFVKTALIHYKEFYVYNENNNRRKKRAEFMLQSNVSAAAQNLRIDSK